MPENTNEQIKNRNQTEEEKQRKYREERTKKTRDTQNLVVEDVIGGNDKNDMFSSKVVDVSELINNQTSEPVIRKLNRLKNFGLTDEMIINAYDDLAGNVTKKSEALSVLNVVFDRYVEYISGLPNGIVLDPITGKINEKASYEQRIELGILRDPFAGIDLENKISIDEILNIDRESLEEGFEQFIEEYQLLIANFNHLDWTDKEKNEEEFNEFLGEYEELVVSNTLKELDRKNKEEISNSIYEQDPYLFEITRIEINLEKSKGTSEYDVYLSQRDKFYREHPDYKGNIPILDAKGNFNEAEAKNVQRFRELYKVEFIISRINKYKKMTPEQISSMSEKDRRTLMMSLMSSMKFFRKTSPEFKELIGESEKILKEFYPQLDFSNKTDPKMQQIFAEFAKKELGVKGDFESLNFTTITEFTSEQINNMLEDYLIRDTTPLAQKNFDDVNVNMVKKGIKGSAIENYFLESKIQFPKEEFVAYEEVYRSLSVVSWIDNKDQALRLRYSALRTIKEEYEKMPSSSFIKEKIEKIDKQIEDFESKFGKIGMDGDELSSVSKYELETYRENMINANLMKFYTRDALEFQKGMSYSKLDDKHKKAYIRNTLVGLQYVNMTSDFCFSKMVLRRLELMNSPDKKFITFDNNGNITINKDLILQEYSDMSEYDYKSFDELLQSAEQRKNDYLLKKLEEYSMLEENDFYKIKNPKDNAKAIIEIEEVRAKSNRKVVTQEKTHKQTDDNGAENKKTIADGVYETAVKNGVLQQTELDVSGIDSKKRTTEEPATVSQTKKEPELVSQVVQTQNGAGVLSPEAQVSQKIDENSSEGYNDSTSNNGSIDATTINTSAVPSSEALVPINPKKELPLIGKIKEIIKSIRSAVLGNKKKDLEENALNNASGNTEKKDGKTEQIVQQDNTKKNWIQRVDTPVPKGQIEPLTNQDGPIMPLTNQVGRSENYPTERDDGPSV